MRDSILWIALSATMFSPASATAAQPHVVFVTGDHEYSGEETLPLLARALESRYGMRTTVLYATGPDGEKDPNHEENIAGLDKLRGADLAVFALRWRRLPADQVAEIERYLSSGRPMIGLRTTSHAFRYVKGHDLERMNAFGELAFGTPPGWGAAGHTHCGHNCSTDVTVAGGKSGHVILGGVTETFHVRSWLYNVAPQYPPRDAEVLLMGKAVKSNRPMADNPVAWTWRRSGGGKSFYTSFGHPEDFQVESVQRLLVNAIHWALGMKPPAQWQKIEIDVAYRGIRPSKPN